VAGGVVEVEQRSGGRLRKERLEDGRVGRDDRLEQTEGRIMALWLLARPRARGLCYGRRGQVAGGIRVPEEVRLALLLRAHASWDEERRVEVERLGQLRPYEAVLSDEAAPKHAKETCRGGVGASAAPAVDADDEYGREKREWSRVWVYCTVPLVDGQG
jgi:hypothetical protein